MDRRASFAVPASIRVRIPDQLPTLFEPQKAMPHVRTRSDAAEEVPSPERRLTVLALQLAVLEKAASRLGTLAFVWATVVLLGGFAITLGRTDFWCITGLLLIEGTRILGRSHELEWQHQATWRRHRPVSCAIVRAFSWMQLVSASACVSLSLIRLLHQHYGGSEEARTNRSAALNIFYGLALAEALLFLAEKALWQWKMGHRRLLERVAEDCNLADACGGEVAVRRFFYDSYSCCLNGSIFDGLHMDLVSYADDLVTMGSHDEQILGVGILVSLAESDRFADAALRKIGVSAPTIERLIEMLSWKDSAEREVRRSAAVVVSMLTERKHIALRITGIPGAIESVASLLYADLDELNILGLSILNKLAHDHDNCDKIGNTRGLLDKIISYSSIDHGRLAPTTPRDMRLKAVKQSLRVVKRLAGTTGNTGKLLRRELTDIVFTVSNVREVLQHHDKKVQSELHQLGIEILTSLAMDKEAREVIGGTGGVVRVLVSMFLSPVAAADFRHADAIRVEAGEALAMLALESKNNCGAIIMALGGGVGRLVAALNDPVVIVGAARILHNLCSYAGDEWQIKLKGVTAGATKVLRTIMVEKEKVLNIFLGLAAQMVQFMEPRELKASLATASVVDTVLAGTLVQVLRQYSRPSMDVPRVRRYTIELAVAMMRSDARYVALFVELGMEGELRRVAGTTSQLECFNVFSGSVGLSRHTINVSSLVTSALELMKKN
ncbi:uncharacterized protein [Lolium perenne]|uniref:uncharacterized protein n=1 Tax=Lolium perenne TaxID=4522 RepID=UPI0021EA126E|nr:uncharacterized protein LOC127307070 [Lolium perenne]